ncbi:MAG: CatB-related O-acetyltransferase [Clostridium sp.]
MKCIIRAIKLWIFAVKWKKRNLNNFTEPKIIFDIDKVKVGKGTYGRIEVYNWEDKNEYLEIGNYVSIANGVKFILGGNHNYKCVSTYPFKRLFLSGEREASSKGPIVINDDVWIGMDSIILSNITIGVGAIVAAGSVVTKDVEPYSIVAGNPAVKIKYRFNEKIRNKLLDIKWEEITDEFIKENIDILEKDITEENIDEIIRCMRIK